MNRAIFVMIGSVIGAAIGGSAAYVYLNKKYDGVFDKETEAYRNEIDELRKSNNEFQIRLAGKNRDKKEEFFENEKVVEVDDPDSLIIDEDDDNDGYDAEPTTKAKDIRFISQKDYEDDDDYEKEEFKYFMSDGVITQDDEILEPEEFEQVCGSTALILLKKDKSMKPTSGSDNELYIRNEQYDTDYKVVRYHSSYEDHMNK